MTRGDRAWRAGREAEAAQQYRRASEAVLASEEKAARALLHLGLLYALPGGELHDPAEARRILQRLRYRYPESLHAREAELLLASMSDDPAEPPVVTPETVDVEELPALISEEDLRAALEEERLRAAELAEQVSGLRSEAQRLRARIAQLEAELAQLKAIDLREPPP